MERSCPLGHTCSKCLWERRIRGTHPQTGEEVDKVECAISLLPMLLIENSQKQHQTAAAIEDFRNKTVEGNGRMAQLMVTAMQNRLRHE